MFYSWRIKSSKNFLRNHAVKGLFFKNCSGDEVGSKNIFKNTPCLSTHNLTDSVNHGMVKNTKAWISWEWNINFLWNKKNLNLCRRWNILRSCRFVTEVTFKFSPLINISQYDNTSWAASIYMTHLAREEKFSTTQN